MDIPSQNSSPAIPALTNLPDSPDAKVHIPELDGLRGIAILLVLVVHFNPIQVAKHDSTKIKLVAVVLGSGWVGVDLFFVLSGFLITGILIKARESPHRFRNFYCRRTLRIFPLYYGVLILYYGVVPLARHLSYRSVMPISSQQFWYWGYVSNLASLFGIKLAQPGLGHFWSLAVEEQFYLVWPTIIFLLDLKWLPWVVLLAVITSFASKCWLISHAFDGYAIYTMSLCRIETLSIGAALAGFVSAKNRRSASGIFLGLATLSACICLAIASVRHQFGNWDPVVQLIGFPALAVLFASAVGLAISSHYNAFYRVILRLPPLLWLARYSYGIYVFHELIRVCLLPSAQRWRDLCGSRHLGDGMYVVVGVGSSLAAAILSWNLYERRFIKLKKFFVG